MIPLRLDSIHLDSAATHRGEMRGDPDPGSMRCPSPVFGATLVLPGKEDKTIRY